LEGCLIIGVEAEMSDWLEEYKKKNTHFVLDWDYNTFSVEENQDGTYTYYLYDVADYQHDIVTIEGISIPGVGRHEVVTLERVKDADNGFTYRKRLPTPRAPDAGDSSQ
jgi:hypothetical protein